MFTRLAIKNFKGWSNTGSIRLAPITVFFGSNSAGKTSLLQFLLMLRQSSESRDRKQVLHPGDENTDVDLGTYRDLVYKHDLSRKIEFALDWTLPKTLEVRDVLSRSIRYEGDSMGFAATVSSADDGSRQHIDRFAYTLGDLQQRGLSVELSRDTSHKYEISATNYKLIRTQGRASRLPDPIRFYGFPEEVIAYHQNAAFTSDLTLNFEQQLRRIRYLGPLRQSPKRNYTWSGEAPEGVGFDGRFTIPALLASKDRSLSRGYKRHSDSFINIVARWLKSLGLLESFNAHPLNKTSKQYEIKVEANGSSVETNLPDVGFGVSQVLPVVVESFYAAQDSTVIIEQPELHLHPRVQAFLADLFVEAIHAREANEDRRVQFIIESHSEHFIYRLQRLIAEGKVKPEEVALYCCKPGPTGSIIEPLKVDDDGEILNWPENFFGNEMEDVRARLEAAAARTGIHG